MATKSKPSNFPGQIEVGEVTNFSGGPNFRDSVSELGANEAYASFNITFDERGGAASRLGYTKRNLTPLGAAGDKPINDYYSPLLNAQLTQVGKSLYRADSGTAVHTFTTTGCVTFAELANKVIVGHPVDGLFSSPDGITWTHITAANAPTTANCICTWESKLFVGLADGTVHWSAASDPGTWNANDFNAVWTKDQAPIVALAIGSGQDIQGRPGLLVFKKESVYRINDSGTGAYTVLDTTYGAAGPKAVVGVGARVIYIGKGGIFWWREDQAAPVAAGDLLRPLWDPEQLSFSNQPGWCAGRRLNRAYFSLSSTASSVNDIAIEYHPDEGWIAPRSDAMACYSTDLNSNTYGGSPSVDGQIYHLDTGGTDDGTAISWSFQSRWIVPNGGFKVQLWQIRAHGRGMGTLTVRTDYADSGGVSFPFDLSAAGSTWGAFVWGDGTLWTAPAMQQTQAFYGIGTCREFSVRLSGTSTTTTTGRSLFGDVVTPTVGAFSLYALEHLFIPLGLS